MNDAKYNYATRVLVQVCNRFSVFIAVVPDKQKNSVVPYASLASYPALRQMDMIGAAAHTYFPACLPSCRTLREVFPPEVLVDHPPLREALRTGVPFDLAAILEAGNSWELDDLESQGVRGSCVMA